MATSACGSGPLPPALELALGRAQGAIETAEGASTTRRARSAVRSGLQLLDAAAQRVRAAEGRHLIATDCGRTLRGMVRQARVLARRYLKKHATARADGG